MNNDQSPPETGSSWEALVHSHAARKHDELPLANIAPGDQVLVRTRNTHYLFAWQSPDLALLRTSSAHAPTGPVRIMGCSFGLSSSIRPDALFCGGNLEFTHSNGEKTWTTSSIREIHHLQKSLQPTETKP
jgi:hypothetical protein